MNYARTSRVVFMLVGLSVSLSTTSHAQAAPVWFERAQTAFEEQRYDDAEYACQWILDREPDHAGIRYLLARVQLGLGDNKQAYRSITRILKDDPENIEYLEVLLQTDFPFELLPALRNTRKNEVAEKILALDSTNVVAHVQLGMSDKREWIKWRDRISIKKLGSLSAAWRQSPASSVDVLPPEQRSGMDWIQVYADDPGHVLDVDRRAGVGLEALDLSTRAEQVYPLAVRHFRKALESDPTHREALLSLAMLYITFPDLNALRELANSQMGLQPVDFYPPLLAGYTYHATGDEQKADTYFSRALQLMPDSTRAAYESPERLVSDKSRKNSDQDPEFTIDGFWQTRDPMFITSANERKLEHLARMVYADLVFSEPILNLAGRDSDRGDIYIRYGPPERDYFLSNALADCSHTTYENFHVFQYVDDRFVFGNALINLNEFTLYSPCAQAFSSRAVAASGIDFVLSAREAIRTNPERYEYEPPGSRIEFPYLSSVFKSAEGGADVYVPYGIPLPADAKGHDVPLSMRTGGFLISPDGSMAAEHRRDVNQLGARQIFGFEAATLWIDAHRLSVPPGSYELSVEFETDARKGAGYHRTTIEAPNYSTGELLVSDLLLAYLIEEQAPDETDTPPGTIVRNGLVIQPAPWGVFGVAQPLYLYFELYNLQKQANLDTHYEIEAVLVERQDAKGLERLIRRAFRRRAREGVSVRFENTGSSPDEGQYFIMDTTDQPAGTYVLVVRAHDLANGAVAESRRIVMLE